MAIQEEDLNDFIKVIDKIYREVNKRTDGTPPSSLYERMEKHYSAWLNSNSNLNFYKYLKGILKQKT